MKVWLSVFLALFITSISQGGDSFFGEPNCDSISHEFPSIKMALGKILDLIPAAQASYFCEIKESVHCTHEYLEIVHSVPKDHPGWNEVVNKSTGKLHYKIDGILKEASATFVATKESPDKNLILTAGHTILNRDGSPRKITEVFFCPNYYLTQTCTEVPLSQESIEDFKNRGLISYHVTKYGYLIEDHAVLRLKENPSQKAGKNLEPQILDFSEESLSHLEGQETIWLAGQSKELKRFSFLNCIGEIKETWLDNIKNIGHNCPTKGGYSGGGVYISEKNKLKLVGLVSSGATEGDDGKPYSESNYNQSTIITKDLIEAINLL